MFPPLLVMSDAFLLRTKEYKKRRRELRAKRDIETRNERLESKEVKMISKIDETTHKFGLNT